MRSHVFVSLLAAGALVTSLVSGPAVARAAPAVEVGMSCTVADGWWSLDRERPVQPEPVKVLAIKALTTGAPGAWVQPSRGKLTEHQLHIALDRLSDCR